MAIYKGFSTANWLSAKNLTITDIEAVKTDLRNHIFTRLGERVMQPGFGTRIPDLPFEPNDKETLDIIREDLVKVVEYDPRVKLLSLDLLPIPDNNAIIAIVEVLYIELNVQGELRIDVKAGTLT